MIHNFRINAPRCNFAQCPTRKPISTMSKLTITLLALFVLAFALPTVSAEDWTQFRGPNGSGVSASTGLPQEFGPNKNVVWKTELPPGHSSPVLTADRIFVTAHTKEKENHKLFVICLDRQTGKILWQREVMRSREGTATCTSTIWPRKCGARWSSFRYARRRSGIPFV